MRAYRFYAPERPLKMEDVPMPEVADNDVLVKIKATGICGTDVHYMHGTYPPGKLPIILGHECAGIVQEVGRRVEDLSVGDRVVINYVFSCGKCVHCIQGNDNRCLHRKTFGVNIDGGFTEFAAVPERNAFKLPDNVPFDQAAIIGCAVTTPFHALRVGELRIGDAIAIFGLGGVGIHAVAWAKIAGAAKIFGIDIVDFKLRLAKKLGADETINPSKRDPVKVIHECTSAYGVDIAIDCAGLENTVNWAVESVSRENPYSSGVVVCVAVPPKILIGEPYRLREGSIRKSGNHTRDDLRRVIRLVEAGRIDLSESVTHRIPFSDLNRGFRILEEEKEDVVRVVVTQ